MTKNATDDEEVWGVLTYTINPIDDRSNGINNAGYGVMRLLNQQIRLFSSFPSFIVQTKFFHFK